MNWAWDQRLPPTSKLILMALADSANEEGRCWPAVKTIAGKCGISARTVQRLLKDFEANDLLVVSRRTRADGGQTSNCYRLGMPPPDKLSSPSTVTADGMTQVSPLGVTEQCRGGDDAVVSPQEPLQEPAIEPSLQQAEAPTLLLPSQLTAADKRLIVGLLQNVPSSDAQMLLDELAAAVEARTKIKTTPARWFSGVVQKYLQGQFNAVGALAVADRRKHQVEHKRSKPVAARPEIVRVHLAEIAGHLGARLTGTCP